MANCDVEPILNEYPCSLTLGETHDSIKRLLPHGRAWPRDDKSNLQKYWRAFAIMIKGVEDAMCSLMEEAFCDTTDKLKSLWLETYGLPDDCDPSGRTLCARVAAQGGSTCDYFVYLASLLGYQVECGSLLETFTQAGCFQAGCAQCPPSIQTFNTGSELGYLQAGDCKLATGSELGRGVLSADCCNLAGYRSEEVSVIGKASKSPCVLASEFPANQTLATQGSMVAGYRTADSARFHIDWVHHWIIYIDVEDAKYSGSQCIDRLRSGCACAGESLGRINAVSAVTYEYPMAGCFEAGCASLCQPDWADVFCFLERYKPAHTVLHYRYT